MFRSRRALLRACAVILVAAIPLSTVVAGHGAIASAASSCVATGSWSGNCEISQGDDSMLTYAAQTVITIWALAQSEPASCDPGITGEFTAATKTAVECFQQDHDLSVDGIIGPQTWGKLQAQLIKQTSPSCDPTGWCYFKTGGLTEEFRQWSPTGVWWVFIVPNPDGSAH